MPDLSAIAAIMTSLNSAVGITRAMKELNDGAAVQSKVIELQGAILDAQSQLFAANSEHLSLGEKLKSLQNEIELLKAWENEGQKYKLADLGEGQLVYSLKDTSEGPPHHLCANCFQAKEKSILQSETRYPGRCDVLACNKCGGDIYISGSPDPEHFKNRARPRR